jgi:hypothetical protein
MALNRIDVIRLFDIDLSTGGRITNLRASLQSDFQSPAFLRYKESFSWLFDPQDIPGSDEQRKIDPTKRYLSDAVNCAFSLPEFDRFSLSPDGKDQSDKGGVITISEALRIAVVCLWNRYSGDSDAIDLKLSLDTSIPRYYLNQISILFPYIAEAELMYPFFGIRCEEIQLEQVLAKEEFLGRLFSGGLEHEADQILKNYVQDNLSHRRYEALFVRSSDGLGVYTWHIEQDAGADQLLYENTLFRAVQVCELCLLEHRLIRSFKSQVDQDARKVRILPRPLLVEQRRNELLRIEMGMIKALPFRTAEGRQLIRKVQEKFNIPQSLQDAKDSYNFLETRYQNTKTTALAIVAVIAYIFDKMKVWEWLGALLTGHLSLLLYAQRHVGG